MSNSGSGEYGYQRGGTGGSRRTRGQDHIGEEISGSLTGTGVGGNSPLSGHINRQPGLVSGSTGWGPSSQTRSSRSPGITGQQERAAGSTTSSTGIGPGSDLSSSGLPGFEGVGSGTTGPQAVNRSGYGDQTGYGNRSSDFGAPISATISGAAPGAFSGVSGAAGAGSASRGRTLGEATQGARQPAAGSGCAYPQW